MDAKNIIRKIIRECVEKLQKEEFETSEDWYYYFDELTRDIFGMIKYKEKVTFNVMPKEQYHNALKDFVKHADPGKPGEFFRFPVKYVFQWKQLILENIAKLDVLTAIGGHTPHFPFEEFYDTFDYNQKTGEDRGGNFSKWCKKKYKETKNEDYIKNYNFSAADQFLNEVCHIDDYLPTFSNGAWLLSDFGLKPLLDLGAEIINQTDPNEIIVTISRVLDIVHQRSDLAEIFIEGGSKSLDYISNT
jgi:hypothetical protein